MFGNRRRYNTRYEQGNSITKTIVNIATIVSTAVTCTRLAYFGIISIQVAVLIMLGVVVFVALGNNIAKVVLAATALFLFVLLYSYGDREAFTQLMTQMLALIITLVGLYVILRGVFRSRN
jgi:hypothetical protein